MVRAEKLKKLSCKNSHSISCFDGKIKDQISKPGQLSVCNLRENENEINCGWNLSYLFVLII